MGKSLGFTLVCQCTCLLRTSSPCAATAGRNDAPRRPARQPHRRQRDAAHRRTTPLTAPPHAPRARRAPRHRHAVKVHVPHRQARTQPEATMHLALRGCIGAAALVGHPRQRDAGHRLMHTRRRSCECTAWSMSRRNRRDLWRPDIPRHPAKRCRAACWVVHARACAVRAAGPPPPSLDAVKSAIRHPCTSRSAI